MCEGMSFLPPETLIPYDPETMPSIMDDPPIEDDIKLLLDGNKIQLSNERSHSLRVISCSPVERRRSPRLIPQSSPVERRRSPRFSSQCSPELGVRRSLRITKKKS